MSDLQNTLEQIAIPRNEEGPVFDEPWQAQAFALTVKLNEAGHFTWSEWADIFGAEIAKATKEGRGCGNEDYYMCWLAALETIVSVKNILSREQLFSRKEEWQHANAHTEYGKPIKLDEAH